MTVHLQRLLLLLHKAARRQPPPHRMAESSRSTTHRLRVLTETLQVCSSLRAPMHYAVSLQLAHVMLLCSEPVASLGALALFHVFGCISKSGSCRAAVVQEAQHTASKFETHLYMGILQPACIQLREKLSSDMDVRQCALSYMDFGADCALQCLFASDEQLSSGSGKIANMFSLCQHATSTVAELLLHVAAEELDHCEAASFTEVAERVSDENVWGQLQETMTSLRTIVDFVKDRLSTIG